MDNIKQNMEDLATDGFEVSNSTNKLSPMPIRDFYFKYKTQINIGGGLLLAYLLYKKIK